MPRLKIFGYRVGKPRRGNQQHKNSIRDQNAHGLIRGANHSTIKTQSLTIEENLFFRQQRALSFSRATNQRPPQELQM
jgi:hypothetical protein